MIHLSNVDLSSESSEEESNASTSHRRMNTAAQRSAASNIIRIEMMGDKSKPVRTRAQMAENSPHQQSHSEVDVLISRSEIASFALLDNGNGSNQEAQQALREGSPALKALEQTHLFSEGLLMRQSQQDENEG